MSGSETNANHTLILKINKQGNDGVQSSSRQVNSTGLYRLRVTIEGCEFEDSVQIEVDNCEQGLYIPAVFSPNVDLINDLFEPLGKYFRAEFMSIYNRWEGLAFLSESGAARGENVKGEQAQEGV